LKIYNEQTMENIHIDLDTSNVSFLKVSAILQASGVKNYCFFLQLNDKGLKGVDPYDPDLSTEMKFRVFRECATNRWYFYREVFRVEEKGAAVGVGGGTSFKLNRGNLAYLWANSLNISSYLIMPRQTGKTVAAIADCVWVYQFVRNSSILHFNKQQTDSNDNIRKIQNAIAMLPMYLQHSATDNLTASDKRKVKNNEKNIRNVINSTIEAMASAGNEAKADSMARGRTANKIWYDEMAFIFFNSAIYTAATPAYAKAAAVAAKNGIPYGISITTTPGDLATPHGEWAYQMMESCIKFDEHMYDMKRKKLFDIVENTPDKTNFLFIQFNHLQLGETDEWFQEAAKKMNNPLKVRREYLLEWINSNGNSPFDPDDLELIFEMSKMNESKAETYKINKYYNLVVYDEYKGKKPVIIGVDVSGGLGRDNTAVVVVNPETLLPMAFFKSNMIPSDHLKKLLVTLVNKRYPHCILTIENNSVGKPLLDELRDTSISRVLYKEKKKKQIDQGPNNFTRKRHREVMEYGHNTNPTTRAQMMEMLESIVHNSHQHMAYPELHNELKFLELKNGRIDHNSATHDDCIMAYMGALWIVRYGTGLKGRGIYYTIQEKLEDEDQYRSGNAAVLDTARRMVLNKHKDNDDAAADELVEYMRSDLHIDDSGSLAAQERKQYFDELDRIEGITDYDDEYEEAVEKIDDSTQRLILQNYYNMLKNTSGVSPIEGLLMPENIALGREEELDWSNLYSMH